MPALQYPQQSEIDYWNVRERGPKSHESPRETFEVDQSTCERVFLVNWPDRYKFIRYMLGYAQTWDDSGTTRLSRLLPYKHRDLPDLVATKVTSVVGHRWTWYAETVDENDTDYRNDEARHHKHPDYRFKTDQFNVYDDAEITVLFEHVEYDRVEDAAIADVGYNEMMRYVSRGDVTPSGEALQLPGAVFNYTTEDATSVPHGIKIPFNCAKILPQEKFVLTWKRLPEDVWTPDSTLYRRIYIGDAVGDPLGVAKVPYIGTVNRKNFYGRPKGTVLFESVRPLLKKSPLGVGLEWDLEFTFVYKPEGWLNLYYFGLGDNSAYNGYYFVRAQGGTIYTPDVLGDDIGLYNTRDHNLLFSVN